VSRPLHEPVRAGSRRWSEAAVPWLVLLLMSWLSRWYRPDARKRCRRLERLIEGVFRDSLQTYGAPRVHAELRARGVRVGKKRVARLMRRLELEGVSRRGKRRRTTVLDPAAPPAPDLVKRNFASEWPDQLWLADITYLPTYEGWLFLAVVMDLCSRKIVSAGRCART
jgi:putative transposase